MNRNVTEVVGFANVMDFYDWLGDKEITVQTMFGLQYIKDFFGFSTLFLLPDDYIRQKPSSQHQWKILIYIILIPATAISKAWT